MFISFCFPLISSPHLPSPVNVDTSLIIQLNTCHFMFLSSSSDKKYSQNSFWQLVIILWMIEFGEPPLQPTTVSKPNRFLSILSDSECDCAHVANADSSDQMFVRQQSELIDLMAPSFAFYPSVGIVICNAFFVHRAGCNFFLLC